MKYLYILFAILFIYSCKPSTDQPVETRLASAAVEETSKPKFLHVVYFWMKEDITDEEKKFFEAGMEKLGKIESIAAYEWGVPAGTDREVVDNSYTYAWITYFDTSADHDSYQDDPIHLGFIEESKHLWTRVQVYDSILEH